MISRRKPWLTRLGKCEGCVMVRSVRLLLFWSALIGATTGEPFLGLVWLANLPSTYCQEFLPTPVIWLSIGRRRRERPPRGDVYWVWRESISVWWWTPDWPEGRRGVSQPGWMIGECRDQSSLRSLILPEQSIINLPDQTLKTHHSPLISKIIYTNYRLQPLLSRDERWEMRAPIDVLISGTICQSGRGQVCSLTWEWMWEAWDPVLSVELSMKNCAPLFRKIRKIGF